MGWLRAPERLDEEFFVLSFAVPIAAGTPQEIQTGLDSLDHRGNLIHRLPQLAAKSRTGFLDHFERSGENLIGANELRARRVSSAASPMMLAMRSSEFSRMRLVR